MSAALASPPPAPDPVRALLLPLAGRGPVPTSELSSLWATSLDVALDVASDLEDAGLLVTIEDDDGPSVELTSAGLKRAGVGPEAGAPEGHKRIPYFDAWGKKRWLLVPTALRRGIETARKAASRNDARYQERHNVRDAEAPDEDVSAAAEAFFGAQADEDAVEPLEALLRAEAHELAEARARKAPPAPGAVRHAPQPVLILGLGCRWDGPDALAPGAACPGCGNKQMSPIECCVFPGCDRSGNEAWLEPVRASERPKPQAPPAGPPKPRPKAARPKSLAPALDSKPKARKRPRKATAS